MLNPITLIDGYKTGHRTQYPEGTQYVYSNFTPRSSRINTADHVVFFGLQYFLLHYLTEQMKAFFDADVDTVCANYERRMTGYLGHDRTGSDHIRALHALGYLPLDIRALPEGTKVPLGVPMLTVENTDPDFFWLVNYFETLLSSVLWLPITSATTAERFRDMLTVFAERTGSDLGFVGFQGHDFSFRGMQNPEAAALSGAGHLLSFEGTDTIPALDIVEDYYAGMPDGYLIGASVDATEHSVMCAGGMDDEMGTFERLLDTHPTGILSVVSDTWDLWNVLTNILPALKDKILARDGKLVIRPDSGDPVLIVCGNPEAAPGSPQNKGVIRLLHETFGGTKTSTGHIMLDSHIGCIYGDGIDGDRMYAILSRLDRMGFSSGNMVFGLGSFTYTYVTRDTYGMAMKATWAQVNGVGHDLFKDPVTDDGGKKSATGRLAVRKVDGKLTLVQRADGVDERLSELRPVWRDGTLLVHESFDVIRDRARS